MERLFATARAEQSVRDVFCRTAVPAGYAEVKMPVLESYETYETVQSQAERSRLLKMIGRDGAIRVLRPDMTIALMKELAAAGVSPDEPLRCWYMQPVFRQEEDREEPTERRQAGIELFGAASAQHDAEALTLACRIMDDAGLNDIKIEIGHAGILREAARCIGLSEEQMKCAADLLQQKNGAELESFIRDNQIDEEGARLLKGLLYSYGDPGRAIRRLGSELKTERSGRIFRHLTSVLRQVAIAGYGDCLVVNFGLVNDMDYYSGIRFQGYSSSYGRPVLMGGRYDGVARRFGADLPAVGFACQVDALQPTSRKGAEE